MQINTISRVGNIATALRQLQVELLDASVSVRHEEREDIVINANYPSCWEIDGTVVRQTKVMVPSGDSAKVVGGCFIGGVTQHSRGIVSIDSISVGNGGVFVGGNNSGSISVGHGGVHVGGRNTGCISTSADRTEINAGGRRIVVENGEVSIDGKKVEDDGKGAADQAATASEAKPSAPDRLEIIVPLSYRGSLEINNPGGGDVNVDAWQGAYFIVAMSGNGDLKTGILSDIVTVDLNSSGNGDIEIASLSAEGLIGVLSGSGDLEIDELNADKFILRQSGSGDTTISSGYLRSGMVYNSGSGDTTMRGCFGAVSKHNTGSGDIKIRVRK